MSVLKSSDDREIIVMCNCGCGETIHIQLSGELNDKDTPPEDQIFSVLTYMNMNWYRDQGGFVREKIRKIWRILRNRDYCYSEVLMTPKDWLEFKEWVNRQDAEMRNID